MLRADSGLRQRRCSPASSDTSVGCRLSHMLTRRHLLALAIGALAGIGVSSVAAQEKPQEKTTTVTFSITGMT